MSFGHKKLDVYRISLEYIHWVYDYVDHMKGIHRHARDQLLRASQSIPLNIAEGNGKYTDPDRQRFFAIARGSALECAVIQDVLLIAGAVTKEDHVTGEKLLFRIVSMLTKMLKQTWNIREDPAAYGNDHFDHEHDHEHECELEF